MRCLGRIRRRHHVSVVLDGTDRYDCVRTGRHSQPAEPSSGLGRISAGFRFFDAPIETLDVSATAAGRSAGTSGLLRCVAGDRSLDQGWSATSYPSRSAPPWSAKPSITRSRSSPDTNERRLDHSSPAIEDSKPGVRSSAAPWSRARSSNRSCTTPPWGTLKSKAPFARTRDRQRPPPGDRAPAEK